MTCKVELPLGKSSVKYVCNNLIQQLVVTLLKYNL